MRILVAGATGYVGSRLAAFTGIAGIGFLDTMVVTEYDPQPPFDAGSVAKAPAPIVDLVNGVLAQRQREVSG